MEALNAVVARVKQCMFGACDAAAALLVGAAVPIRTPPLCTHHGRTSVSQSRATRNSAAAARDRRRSVAAAAPMGQPPQKSGDCSECRRQYRPQHLRQPLLPLQVPLLLLAAETASRCAQQRVGRAVHPLHAAATAALCRCRYDTQCIASDHRSVRHPQTLSTSSPVVTPNTTRRLSDPTHANSSTPQCNCAWSHSPRDHSAQGSEERRATPSTGRVRLRHINQSQQSHASHHEKCTAACATL